MERKSADVAMDKVNDLAVRRAPAYNPTVASTIQTWLATFALDECLHAHVAVVMATIPDPVRVDLMTDPAFVLHDYDPPERGVVTVTPVGSPVRGRPGRAVSLKRSLRRRPTEFVRWVIAHELAHAHLRNRGRFEGEDPEVAADGLAADWGFPRPR